jgi:hypothetical protein
VCHLAWGAEQLPLLSIQVYDNGGVTLAGEVEIQLISTMSGEDHAGKLKDHLGHVPEGPYRLKVSANGFDSYEETIRVSWPRTDVRVGLIVGDIANYGDLRRPTSELISGYVDSKISKGRDLWVQVYPVFRPQEPGRVTQIGADGHFKLSVPVALGPWLLTVVEMFGGPYQDLPKTERFPFPKVVGSRVVHTSDMPVKIALESR